MGSKTVFYNFETEKSQEEVMAALEQSMLTLGGQVTKISSNSLMVVNGKEGVQFGFAANLEAMVTISQNNFNKYNILCDISWKMNTLSLACLIIGIFVFGILWIVPLLYLFLDPKDAYQTALLRAAAVLK